MSKIVSATLPTPADDMLEKVEGRFSTILADPPWQFQNRTGKVAPEHRRLLRYPTMELQEIMDMPIGRIAAARSHIYLWVPNALLMEGLQVMKAWGFTYKSNIVWFKVRKDGGPDGRGGPDARAISGRVLATRQRRLRRLAGRPVDGRGADRCRGHRPADRRA